MDIIYKSSEHCCYLSSARCMRGRGRNYALSEGTISECVGACVLWMSVTGTNARVERRGGCDAATASAGEREGGGQRAKELFFFRRSVYGLRPLSIALYPIRLTLKRAAVTLISIQPFHTRNFHGQVHLCKRTFTRAGRVLELYAPHTAAFGTHTREATWPPRPLCKAAASMWMCMENGWCTVGWSVCARLGASTAYERASHSSHLQRARSQWDLEV